MTRQVCIRHNCRYCNDENSHWNVWIEILGNRIIAPFFIDDTLNGSLYMHVLEKTVTPISIAAFENDGVNNDSVFQQDGAAPHFFLFVSEF